jgi:RHS repeat-associated protein
VETGNWTNGTSLSVHLDAAKISTSYPVTSSGYEELTKTFYDNYDWLQTNSVYNLSDTRSTTDDNYLLPASTSFPFSQAVTQSNATKGRVTGVKAKVHDPFNEIKYLYAISYYDNKGRVIQTQTQNYNDGVDVITMQYNWSGQPLLTIDKTNKAVGNPQIITVLTQLTYDDLRRLTKIQKKVRSTLVNGNTMPADWTTIVQNEYDELGQLKFKKIGNKPGASGTPLAKLEYQYNIRGWLLSVNKDYIISGVNNDQYFGMELGYDKHAALGTFSPQYNGNISGSLWKSEGDQQKRKYNFSYDAASRLTNADFNQYVSGSSTAAVFDKSALIDFSVNNLQYDANGNITSMAQNGLKGMSSLPIDNLTYQYKNNNKSNQLVMVTDGVSFDNGLGDFKDGTNTGDDYSYDANGNITIDKNKNIDLIEYNQSNLPERITIKDKSNVTNTIVYKYNAATGGKIQKEVYPGAVPPGKITLYLGGSVFEDNVLQFTAHEEGRIRFKPAAGSEQASFVYDYFIKDHLGNVRVVLTEEQDQDAYPAATLENSAISVEDDYYTIDASKVVDKSVVTGLTDYQNNNGNPPYNNNPSSNTTANSEKLYQLNATANKTGLGITLKVMAGDQINVFGKSYWFNSGGNYSEKFPIPVGSILDAFLGAPAMVGKGLTTAGITTPGLTDALDAFKDRIDNVDAPWAYINWIFFDEQFKYAGSGFERVGANGVVKDHALVNVPSLKAPKNGYVFVYCSNESQHNVYFDNLQVFHSKGPLLEETHYYPFGLIMQGISSKALAFGGAENRKKFNGIEHTTEFDLNMYDAFFRSADPQIGRWWQVDPKPNMAESQYAMMGNNPVFNADPLGDTVRGSSNQDARRLERIIRQTFRGREMKAVRQLFQRRLHAGDKQTFAGVASWRVDQATANLNADQKSLVKGYVDAINSKEVHTVEVVRRGEDLKDANSIQVMGAITTRTGSDVDAAAGGGFNIPTFTGTHSVIVMNSTANISDYRDNNTGNLVPGMTSGRGELLAHEMIGHGSTRSNPGGSQFLNAIQLTNLYHRVTGTGNLYRDGTSHGGTNGVPLTYPQASGVPAYLQP